MKIKNKIPQYLITSASVVMLTAMVSSAFAMDKYAQDGSAGKVVNSAGGCWQTVGGRSDLCGAVKMDSDGDGVLDSQDKCPGTPAGVEVGASGCRLDSDNDGVLDYMDKCPETPKGAPVDAGGCALDSDGDGVADYVDKCPGTPVDAKVDKNGCTEEVVLHNVEFEVNSAELTMAAKRTLGPIADVLKGRPGIKRLGVTGHTDSTGSEAYNKRLSQARAQSVADYFTAAGIKAKTSAWGMGEDSPVADNNTVEGRAQNRRVELKVSQ
ncbi:OmpA family protein [Candidatus Vondammii sp. HM_W22]|uniref:OmpA family protein n=1 Tax=Candidatus Vondammii sp. HM_W22 TaxID=2687299 RepID=UPI001F13C2F6|nr:OmpA family protein [Candidatus Vondammii sp. HM_W22]